MRPCDPLSLVGGSSAGPFTATFVTASNLSVGDGVIVIVFSLAHLTASARFRARAPGPVSGRLSKTTAGGGGHRASASRRVSATGIRFSVILFPPGSWALLTVGLPDPSPDPDRVPVFRTRELQPGWVPSLPRGRRCSPGQVVSLTVACRSSAASPSIPATNNPSTRVPSRGINEGSRNSPVRLSPRLWRPGGTSRPWAFPRASHPADQEPTTHAEVGTGHRSTDLELLAQHLHRVDPPIV